MRHSFSVLALLRGLTYSALICISTALSAQTEKSATPLATPPPSGGGRGEVRAVVVGISDYQDKDIPDLRFADRDAEAFANFLRSPAGGALDGDHLKVLTNEQATGAQLAKTLDWLIEVTQEGDQVIIYFSGHGDVETKRISQPGYLLGWDAPSRVYSAGGAMNVRDFQDIVSTLSVTNKARVVVITDACHSGKLSGSDINGAQLTGQNLARQFANEIKILSCQPNEYSIEGEQWGGGRGAFSFNLVDALYGMADGNNDLFVTLQEVGRYLEDKVTAEVAPVSQVPMVLGNRTERLASVDAKLLADLRSGRTSQMKMLSPVETRGMEDDVLAGVDTTTRELYRLFKKALKDKVFLEPVDACADAYYERLMAETGMARLHSTMTRNYAAALQDDAQQVLNTMLKSGLTSEVLSAAKAAHIYRNYPAYLDRAAELLGSGHYMYAALKARKHYFEGTLQTEQQEKKKQFFQALHWQVDMPHAYAALIRQYPAERADSAEYYASKAMQIAPAWVSPYISLSYFYQSAKQSDKAEEILNRASQVDSSSIRVWYTKANIYRIQKKYDAAEHWYLKAIAGSGEDICFPCAYNNLGVVYSSTRRYAETEQQYIKAIQLDSTFVMAYINLGAIYCDQLKRYAEAEQQFKKVIRLDSTYAGAYNNLGVVYFATGRYIEAEPVLKKAIALDSTDRYAWNTLGFVYNQTGRYTEAEPVLKKAIALDSTNVNAWNNLGLVYNQTSRYTEAEPVLKKAIALDSTYVHAWSNLASTYSDTRRYAEAEPVWKKAISLDSMNARRWNDLGWFYNHTRRYAEAEPVFKKAIALDSTFANPRKDLGMVCFKTNRPDEARQNFLKAITLNPDYAGAMLGMAYLFASEGKTEEAIGYVEQAIGKGSTFEQLENDEDLAPLRALPEWKVLMKKYFPDKVKD